MSNRKTNKKRCSIEECNGTHEALGLCAKHYQRYKKHGDANIILVARNTDAKDAINKNYIPVTESGCWIWTGHTESLGYGKICVNGKRKFAHRLSYEVFKGQIPDGQQVNHHCDNPSCINPNHLYCGTQKQNIKDMIERNRVDRKGDNSHYHKLCEKYVIEIRRSHSNLGTMKLSRKYGVSRETIRRIIKNEIWSNV